MAHEIDMTTGTAAIAYVGEKPWHGLGAELKQGTSIEEWIKAAQMNWDVVGTPVRYGIDENSAVYPGQQVLFRSDTKKPLSVVGSNFKVVQPKEVLEFFRDLVDIYDMKLSVAGCLFDGKRFWATAETGRVTEILPGDEVRGQLVLMTGVDGTIATTAKFVSTRVVCNNTLRIAMNETGAKQARRTHRQTFDPQEIKLDLGLLDNAWSDYVISMRKLTNVKMNDDAAFKFFKELVAKQKEMEKDEVALGTKRAVDDLMYRLRNGLGAESGRGTAWNVLNAVTEKYTHGTPRRNASQQFVNSIYGGDANVKDKALDRLMAFV